jgi:succinyl-CoA synthetase alpha subunit
MEAADAGIKVIITITEGILFADMIKANSYVKENASLIGPNCLGILLQVKLKLVSCQVLFSKRNSWVFLNQVL